MKKDNIHFLVDKDKRAELKRYDDEAIKQKFASQAAGYKLGAISIPKVFRTPYTFYEAAVRSEISKVKAGPLCLEIGSGYGLHSGVILDTGASLIATDISDVALSVLRNNFIGYSNLTTEIADMEKLPFGDNFFDFVFSAGSLSYGDEKLVFEEIFRVLKPGGVLVCVDSFGHNIIYRINRYLHYLRGNRTKIVISRIPKENTILALRDRYSEVKVSYFGAFSFLAPALSILFDENSIALFLDKIDRLIKVRKLAFKIVLVAKK